VNDAFNSFFENFDFPARTTIEVAGLPLGACVEIDCIAAIK
jgi:enamine deaminase RidA (YjgF/YER057c/UK114 family)